MRENLIDLSAALDDARAVLEWTGADPALVAQQDRLAEALDDARRELAALLGRAA